MKTHLFITKDAPTVPADPWSAVEAECPAHRARREHAGRLHVLAPAGVSCVAWRPLRAGERASGAWIDAARHRVRVVLAERAIVGGDHARCACRAPGAPWGPEPCSWCGATQLVIKRSTWRLEVPAAREAQYPAPEAGIQSADGAALDRQADATAAAMKVYYERMRAAPKPARRVRRVVEFA